MSNRNILSLMFALNADQVTRLNHYVLNEEGKYELANIHLAIAVISPSVGRFETMIESMNIQRDSITKNIAITLHIVDRDGIAEALSKDSCIFELGMAYSNRTNKLSFNIHYDGYKY